MRFEKLSDLINSYLRNKIEKQMKFITHYLYVKSK